MKTVKITKTKRLWIGSKIFKNGTVRPMECDEHGAPIMDEIARGVVIYGTWYELPGDGRDGKYVLIENVKTNAYGYVEGVQTGNRSLINVADAANLEQNVLCGIINQIAVIHVSGENVECKYDNCCLVRKQG